MHAYFRWSGLIFAIAMGAALAQQPLLLAAGERPPYLGPDLPDGGYVAEVVGAAFKHKGYRVKLVYSTWARAKLQAEQGEVAALVGSGAAPGSDADFVNSEHFFGGSTVLLKKRTLTLPARAGDPATLYQALAPYRVGAVRGGASVPAFEQAGYLNKEMCTTDLKNLDLLDQGQVQLALIDKYTAADLMVGQRPRLIGQLDIVPGSLVPSEFHLAFSKRGANHMKLLHAFNAGLAQLSRDGTLARLMSKHGLSAPRQERPDRIRLTIGTVNNSDMFVMQGLSKEFEQLFPNIELVWRVMDENTLRLRLLSDLAIADGQFDIMTIGTYELPIWAKRGWLAPLHDLPKDYAVDDLLPTLKKHLSFDGQLYGLPFYAESAMTYYRKDLFAKAGLVMPAQPSYEQIRDYAAKVHDPAAGVYGICLRGKPGWGENMALLGTLAHAHGARWFDEQWRPDLASPAWSRAAGLYADMLGKYGPPHPDRNGFNENLNLFSQGHCGIWIDATVAAGLLFDAKRSKVSAQLGYAALPVASPASAAAWLWSWTLAIPGSSQHKAEAQQFIAWATSPRYVQSVANLQGWVAVPPGTRKSTYNNPQYLKAAPFARFVQAAIETADVPQIVPSARPYVPIQYVSIPEFQAIGNRMGSEIASVLRGEQALDKALRRAQNFATDQMAGTAYGK